MSNKPIKTFRSQISPRTTLSVWQNENGISFSMKRSYKDSSGNWKDASSFFAADLAALAEMAPKAIEFANEFSEKTRGQGATNTAADEVVYTDVPAAVQGSLASAPSYDDDDIPF